MSDHHDNLPRFCHPASVRMLLVVFFSLIFLTFLTVLTSSLGMPAAFSFPVAMIIASVKAFLVCAFFMHMLWDKGFNIMAFFSSLLFAGLFIGLTLLDTSANQHDIDQFPQELRETVEAMQAPAAAAPSESAPAETPPAESNPQPSH